MTPRAREWSRGQAVGLGEQIGTGETARESAQCSARSAHASAVSRQGLSAREHTFVQFFQLAALIDGRSPQQLERLVGLRGGTLKRYVHLLRRCGMVLTFDRRAGYYTVLDAGPFNLPRLRQANYPANGAAIISLPRAAEGRA